MAYATQGKENTSQQNNQPQTKATAQLFSDNRESVIPTLQLQEMIINSPHQQKLKTTAQLMANSSVQKRLDNTTQLLANKSKPIQLYTYSAGAINQVTITASANTAKTFNETTTNSVSYVAGEKCAQNGGTGTGSAQWSGVLIDAGTNNAATQLHLVNQDWGGKGGSGDGNIFPGSQSLNGHHKTQENAFRRLFSGPNSTAPVNMTYTCSTSGPIGNHTFPNGPPAADVTLADHTVTVRVTDDTNNTTLLNQNVTAGPGMKIRDPK